uniref:SFRICE_013620 n=1 Tax=Spodoptera frugiperda TaxID=7108 RepID=A0A2H1W6R2_SPOFR
MKQLVILSLILTIVTSYTVKTWTLSELKKALENPYYDAEERVYLESALNRIMYGLISDEDYIHGALPSPTGEDTWTLKQLRNALINTIDSDDEQASLNEALKFLQRKEQSGTGDDSVQVLIAAMDISTWTGAELIGFLTYGDVNPAAVPYLENALNDLDQNYYNGDTITIITPVCFFELDQDDCWLRQPKYYNDID